MTILADMRTALVKANGRSVWGWRIGEGAERAIYADQLNDGNATAADMAGSTVLGLPYVVTKQFQGWELVKAIPERD